MGLGSGALVAGLFGMNVCGHSSHLPLLFRANGLDIKLVKLQSHMEEMPYAFAAMSVASSAIAVLVAWAGLWR
ncbi:hypothetical protein JVT61DRAFT_10071 [Boletus reticuloceps]|uniref:Uncharacterized protein n=1 Tax=Boletus reticuloceps TaxID=495285 RepID=A0A8I2YZP6_9AGAM|nr:hypothetical protein JVT61DRAFT_10071 [Boletus reticuloceps]